MTGDLRFPNHRLISEHAATITMIVSFIEFTSTTWYGSRSNQAHAFAAEYPHDQRPAVIKSVMIVMDNYGIDDVVSERTAENAWNLALDSIGVDHEALDRERAVLREIECGDGNTTVS